MAPGAEFSQINGRQNQGESWDRPEQQQAVGKPNPSS